MFGIEAEVAIVILLGIDRSVSSMRQRIWLDADTHCLADQRTTELIDEQNGSVGVVLGVGRVLNTGDVARKFEDYVLEAATGAEERHLVFPGVADRREGSVFALIRAAGLQMRALYCA